MIASAVFHESTGDSFSEFLEYPGGSGQYKESMGCSRPQSDAYKTSMGCSEDFREGGSISESSPLDFHDGTVWSTGESLSPHPETAFGESGRSPSQRFDTAFGESKPAKSKESMSCSRSQSETCKQSFSCSDDYLLGYCPSQKFSQDCHSGIEKTSISFGHPDDSRQGCSISWGSSQVCHDSVSWSTGESLPPAF